MGQNRKKINGKELVLDISYDIVGSVLYALGIYTFAKTADFAPGGLSGLALIMNHLWRFPIGITTLAPISPTPVRDGREDTGIKIPVFLILLSPLAFAISYRCQMSLLYSAIVLSEEKNPALAMFTSIFFSHAFSSS